MSGNMIASPLLIEAIRAAVCFRMTAQAVENGFVDLEKRKPRPWGSGVFLEKRGIGDRAS